MKSFRDFIFEKLGRMRIVMLGGPGSGKSTYTEYLIKHFNITHIYPCGMLRKEVEKGSEIGQQVKSIIDRGEFVPNQIVLDLITKTLLQLNLHYFRVYSMTILLNKKANKSNWHHNAEVYLCV